jgi:hypothetical protein
MLTFVPIAFTVFLCFFLVLVTCVVLLFAAAVRLLGQGAHLHTQSRSSHRRVADGQVIDAQYQFRNVPPPLSD